MVMRKGAAAALFWLACGGPIAAQEPWPGARCYALTRSPWVRTDKSTRREREPSAPELIVLDSARFGALLGLSDPPDTVSRVVHGFVRDHASGTTRAGYGADRWFSSWSEPAPDSVIVALGTGHGGLDFRFRVRGSRLVGEVTSWVDYGASWRARVVARPTRCPPAPPRLGALRLSVVDAPGTTTPYDLRLPEVRLELATEAPVPCGSEIVYTLVRRDTLVAVTLEGLSRRRPCADEPRPATEAVVGLLKPGRYTVLIGPGGETNRFVLVVTDSSMKLTAERATFVTADERVRARPAHNLFVLRCAHRPANGICHQVESWLVALPGISRPGSFPYRKQINENAWIELFRYDSAATLGRVRACVASIAEQLRPTAGASISIRTWLGEEMSAESGRRAAPNDLAPANVTARGACAG